VFEVDEVVEEVEAGMEADRAGDEGSEFVCGVTEGEEGGFWKSFRMSTFVIFGVGVDEGAGASCFDVDDSDLDNEGATSFVAVGEIIVGGFGDEFDCFKDDGPAC
jgi:hypothetical protein